MFDYIYEWIQNIAFYLVLVTAVLHAIPHKDYKKYIRFFTGLVLILMLLTPVLKLFGTEIRMEDFTVYGQLKEEYEKRLQDAGISEEQTGEENKAEEIEVEEIQIDW